ncbi:hypothetical protein [Leptotrichia wadei]|jgi:putative UDP-3-O-[3-hydroxymyristoyl] glucosamine N-acyltransferase|uniref:Uncharacterized protein n=2 Tax=Leptotrichia wadei TaxID=157687 RepID=A0A510KDW9_9FUSO|nr:hypothetical protein [Leptotrichia wadei]ERK48322.1 hypothetical protein HMPREF9015_01891 [Leptotrichia wadei F0279]BBM49754.1 hypothetical protein JMUB3934_1050 [Leptotrichia wadei]DAS47090.1 MAG TPA: hypothetical protein [Caudoviricetes sp.]
MKLLLSVEEACSFLQMNERTLKSGLISGTLDIGSAIVTKVINNKPRYKYHIPTKRAEKYMGISYEDFLKMR